MELFKKGIQILALIISVPCYFSGSLIFEASLNNLIPKTIENKEMETIGIISATALLPKGLGVRKRGMDVRPRIRSAIVNHPRVFSDDFISPTPMKSRDNPSNEK